MMRRTTTIMMAVIAIAAAATSGIAAAQQRSWFVANGSFSRCIESRGPGARMAELRQVGRYFTATDHGPTDAPTQVDVESPDGRGDTTTWSYFRSREACEAELPGNQPIAERYR